MDDAKLLSRYSKDRSEESFAELVRRYLSLVYFAALRRLGGDVQLAEDVAQIVFSRLARQASQLCQRPSLAGWLYTTTRNVALQTVRTEKRRAAREQKAMVMPDSNLEPAVDWDQIRPVVDEVLDRLGERDRELILLRFFHGNAFNEIGLRFGLTADAARFRVNRALEKMRSLLGKRGIHSTAAALTVALVSQADAAVPASTITAVTAGSLARAAATGVWPPLLSNSFQFMSATKTAAGIAIILGCVAVGLLHHEQALIRTEQARADSSVADYHVTLAQILNVQKALQAAQADSEEMAKTTLETETPQKSIPGTVPAVIGQQAALAEKGQKPTEVNWTLSQNPEVRAALSTWMKSAFDATQGAFYRSAGLTLQQISSLQDLLLQQNINLGSATVTLRPKDVPLSAIYDSIHDVLGDTAYQQFQQYQRTQLVRTIAVGLAGAVYNTDTPLSAQQADQLTQILANNSPSYLQGGTALPNSVNWNAALTQAQYFLTPQQLAALKNEAAILGGAGAINPAIPGAFGNNPHIPISVFTAGASSK